MTPSEKLNAARGLIDATIHFVGGKHRVTGAYLGVTGEPVLVGAFPGGKLAIPGDAYLRDANSCLIGRKRVPNLFPCGEEIARNVVNAVQYGLQATQRETLAQRMASACAAIDAEAARWKGAKLVCDAVHTEYGPRLLVWVSLGNNSHVITSYLWETDREERGWRDLTEHARNLLTRWAEREGLNARRK